MAFAHEVSADESLQKALTAMSDVDALHGMEAQPKDYKLVYVQKEETTQKALYYVFEANEGGFIVVGADSRANAVLGYVEQGNYEQALQNPGFCYWLAECQKAMKYIESQKEDGKNSLVLPKRDIPETFVSDKKGDLTVKIPGRKFTSDATLPASVSPLLKGVAWNQGEPFNGMCPTLPSGEKCVTGCMATAMAQIMKCNRWPDHGVGSKSYTSDTNKFNLYANFSTSNYDWDSMRDNYNGYYTNAQAESVAKLMSDVGISLEMDYDYSSGASFNSFVEAMANYFRYSKAIQSETRSYYTTAEWSDLIKKDLSEGHPVLMSGFDMRNTAGHAFVLDGYNQAGLFHVNWGWGGYSNGYFDVSFMDPDGQGIGGGGDCYIGMQEIALNVVPDYDGTSTACSRILVNTDMDYDEDARKFTYLARNVGLKSYTGKLGFIAVAGDEIIGKYMYSVSQVQYNYGVNLTCTLSNLGLTLDKIGDKTIYVYPAAVDSEGNTYVPQGQVAFPNYVLVWQQNEKIRVGADLSKSAIPNVEVFEPEFDVYAGNEVKLKATLSLDSKLPSFDRTVVAWIYDEYNRIVGTGSDFMFLESGCTGDYHFSCFTSGLKAGKKYKAVLSYEFGNYYLEFDKMIEFTVLESGGEMELAYSGFAIDKTTIEQGEKMTATMKVTNTGGKGKKDYICFFFPSYGGQSVGYMYRENVDILPGEQNVSISGTVNLSPGSYFMVFYDWTDTDFIELSDIINFNVVKVGTGINAVEENPVQKDMMFYDLTGRKIGKVKSKGLYIKNGKKVLVK